MQDVYTDFGYGAFPGVLEHVGAPLGVTQDKWSYAEITKNGGQLSSYSIPAAYRIEDSDI